MGASLSGSLSYVVLKFPQEEHLPPKIWNGTSDRSKQSLHCIAIILFLYSSGIGVRAISSSICKDISLYISLLYNDFLHNGQMLLVLTYYSRH